MMKRNVYLSMQGLEETRDNFLKLWQDRKTFPEEINVEDALARVTSGPVFANLSAPTYHSAAMDGIAVRAEETYGTTEKTPKVLKLGDKARWINTGQALPEGCNAVIMIEKVHQLTDEDIEIISPVYPWQNVKKVGEDIIATQLLLPQNHMIRAYDMGALVTAGVFKIMVRKKPKVIIIPTGTELIRSGEIKDLRQLKKNQIIESNSITLSGLVREAHGEPVVFDIIPDEEAAIRDALSSAAESDADLIIINAG